MADLDSLDDGHPDDDGFESDDGESDPSADPDRIKWRLASAIDAIVVNASDSSFATQGTCRFLSPPRIAITGVGELGIPLGEAQARQMVQVAGEAPYGRGSETRVDRSVRYTWELKPGQFELRNPDRQKFVKGITRTMPRGLGVDGPVRAHLYKMLLYEKGGKFAVHTE